MRQSFLCCVFFLLTLGCLSYTTLVKFQTRKFKYYVAIIWCWCFLSFNYVNLFFIIIIVSPEEINNGLRNIEIYLKANEFYCHVPHTRKHPHSLTIIRSISISLYFADYRYRRICQSLSNQETKLLLCQQDLRGM